MASYYLINHAILNTGTVPPGTLCDAVADPTTYANVAAAGGLWWPSTDTTVAAAAVLVSDMRKYRGASIEDMESIMSVATSSQMGTTLASTATGKGASIVGIADAGSYITATTVEGALQEVYGGAIMLQKRSVTLAVADCTAAGAVKTFTKNVGAVLPANARFAGVSFETFSGFQDTGDTLTWTVSVDGTSVADITAALNVRTGQTGFPKPGTVGPYGYAGAPLGGVQLALTMTSSGNVNGATAGTVTVNVFYVVRS